MNRIALVALAALMVAMPLACGGSSDGRFTFDLTLVGLPDGTNDPGHYQGWAILNGEAFTTGKFRILGTGPDAEVRDLISNQLLGTASGATFGPSSTQIGTSFPLIESATHFFVTREPEGDNDNTPSCDVRLAGALAGGVGTLSASGVLVPEGTPCATPIGGGMARLGVGDFSAAAGVFQFRTPTDDLSNPTPNDFAGVWFLGDDGAGGVQPGLSLPTLPAGSIYEAWAIVDGQTRSLGRFADPAAMDLDFGIARQRGPDGPGPMLPGQDFVIDFTPAFPFDPPVLDLVGDAFAMDGDFRFRVTVEPRFDNDRAPFPLEIFAVTIPPTAVDANGLGTTLDLVNSTLPTADAALGGSSITLTNLSLSDLGDANGRRGHYELWLEDAGGLTSIAKFTIDGETLRRLDGAQNFGTRSSATFDAATTGLPIFPDATQALACLITFENEGDSDAVPGGVLLQGDNEAGMAMLDTRGALASGGRGLADFSLALGAVTLGSPTDNVTNNDEFGIVLTGQNAQPTAVLPPLPEEFVYEGFVEELASGRFFSIGRFETTFGLDSNDQISLSRDVGPKPLRPGEDFLFDVPTTAFTAAQAGSITEVFVTIEAVPDAEIGPSTRRVLEVQVPMGAATATDIVMNQVFSATEATGSVSVNVVN
jgi:hypothetical protein